MSGCRVLIVEDDPLVSSHLESIIDRTFEEADVIISASTNEATDALRDPIDFACLDVDVLDGKTYAFATTLSSRGIPFAFISASDRELVPDELKSVPFVAKPYADADIVSLLKAKGRPA